MNIFFIALFSFLSVLVTENYIALFYSSTGQEEAELRCMRSINFNNALECSNSIHLDIPSLIKPKYVTIVSVGG